MIRELLIRARVDAGLTVRELAKRGRREARPPAESIRTTIHRYGAGGGSEPRMQTVEDVLAALDLELAPITGRKSRRSP